MTNMSLYPNTDQSESLRKDLNTYWEAMQPSIWFASPCSRHSRDADQIPNLENYKGEERDRMAKQWYFKLADDKSIQKLDHLLKTVSEIKPGPEIVATCLQKIFGSLRNSARFDRKVYFNGMMEALSREPHCSAYALLEATTKFMETETYVPSIADFLSKVRAHHCGLHYMTSKLNALKALKHEVEIHLKSIREKEQQAELLLA
ncbi:hypothetical protein [Ahrensia kielensis]|uniref:hypothetical protein n=1 Tax=Ahrensia kielensis TaxID=76980 RepID=UPI0005A7E9A1|nr:hypothetical protein [Ahrensia kielensis]